MRVKYGVAKKRRLPPLAPAPSDREAALLKRKELLREYTRLPSHAASSNSSPSKAKKSERKREGTESDESLPWRHKTGAVEQQDAGSGDQSSGSPQQRDPGQAGPGAGYDDDDDAIELTDESMHAP